MIHNKHDKLIIVGAGGHGKVCIDVAEQMGLWKEIKVIDDKKTGYVLQKEIIGTSELIDTALTKEYDFFVGIGDNKNRKNIFEKISKQKGDIVNLISPHAVISKYVEMGFGNLLMPMSVLNSGVEINDGNIINTASVVEHDTKIKNYVHIAPQASLLGSSVIYDGVLIGSQSVVLPDIKIKENALVGAGSVVVKNVSSNKIVKGLY